MWDDWQADAETPARRNGGRRSITPSSKCLPAKCSNETRAETYRVGWGGSFRLSDPLSPLCGGDPIIIKSPKEHEGGVVLLTQLK